MNVTQLMVVGSASGSIVCGCEVYRAVQPLLHCLNNPEITQRPVNDSRTCNVVVETEILVSLSVAELATTADAHNSGRSGRTIRCFQYTLQAGPDGPLLASAHQGDHRSHKLALLTYLWVG